MSKEVFYVLPDKTSVEQKLQKTLALEYCKRNRWVDNQRVVALLESYDKYITMAKSSIHETIESMESSGKVIYTEFFKFKKNNALFSTICVVPNVVPSNDLTCDAVLNQRYCECFTSASVLLNSDTRPARKKGCKTEILDFVQLYRYDPFGEFSHLNDFSIINKHDLKTYQKYFAKEVGFPHFHFISAEEAEKLGGTARSNAIGLKHLITYISDLNKDGDEKSILNTNSFGMPFLSIKKSPFLYRSTIDLEELLKTKSFNSFLRSINKSFGKTAQNGKGQEGLQGILTDLWVLDQLHSRKIYSKDEMLTEMKLVNKICGGISGKPITLEDPKHEK